MKTKLNQQILTKPAYWNSLPEAVKSMWQRVANRHMGRVVVCTHRPDACEFRGNTNVRRCPTGGRWGKSADIIGMSLDALKAAGFVLVTYTPKNELMEAKRETVYSDDTH